MKKRSIVKLGGVCLICAIMIAGLMMGMIAVMIGKEVLPLSAGKPVAAVTTFLVVVSACLVIVMKTEKNKLLAAFCVAGGYCAIWLLVSGFILPVQELKIGWQIVIPFLAAVTAGVWNSTKKSRRR